ncbi:EAL domain-containing protein [Hoeflea sp. WL0058]|uniref:EAL domain-containing protein n=1 Tax=Flavimaribacter sediminis TaxID=2865987 RepID=A0AAE2ZH78_9HYPH|nr:EAL domain-containing protein [Flavimaribacter sediminis]MBW8636236.1 EAL domain-containing protein [Flavimaribacter sediminis]
MAASAIYYAIMTLAHLAYRGGVALAFLGLASATASVLAGFGYWHCRKIRDFSALETWGFVTNLLIVVNVWITVELAFDPYKLVYFIVMTMIFAAVGISLRQILLSIAIALGAMAFQIFQKHQDQTFVLAFMAFGVAFASIGLWWIFRRAMLQVIASRRTAQDQQQKAEELERVARRQANTDGLTGLPNRLRLLRELDESLDRLSAHRDPFALVILNLDGFKNINDNFGHMTGASLIEQVASKLETAAGKDTFCSRMGGDEFAIISFDKAIIGEPDRFAAQLKRSLAGRYELGAYSVSLSLSGGFLLCADPSMTAAGVIERAEFALAYAKKNLRGEVVVFTEQIAHEMENLFNIDQALRTCNLDEEFSIVFQPQHNLTTGRTLGFEALARWNSPSVGAVTPDLFFRVAETSGMLGKLTPVLLRKALAGARWWPEDLTVSFNLSTQDILSTATIDRIGDVVAQSEIPPERVEFEITETALLHEFSLARDNLNRLAGLGHRIALDDFGVGYSNFNYLKRLPITKLKLDRSFLEDVGERPEATEVIHAMIKLAEILGLEAVVEGVETEAQACAIASVGGNVIQGYFISRPIEPEQTKRFLAEPRQGVSNLLFRREVKE